MKNFKSSSSVLIVILLVVSLLKEIVFTMFVPIWQTPDEQAHFAQVANIAQTGQVIDQGFDLNKEIYTSEVLLGTDRDQRGNNKFTYHPEYKINYTNSTLGFYENQINNLPVTDRTIFVKQEAANYPPLYYQISAIFYKLFYNFGLINRIFAVRFVSIFLNLSLVFVAYLIAKQIFNPKSAMAITLPIMVSFQPMVSFVSAGVNSDNLFNLLFAVIIYLSILLAKNGFSKTLSLGIILTFLLAYLTKPQFVLAIPIILLAILWQILQKKSASNTFKISISIILLLFLGLTIVLTSNPTFLDLLRNFPFLVSFYPGYAKENIPFIDFFKQTLRQTEAQVIPWYWGVFDWLGVVLPHGVNRIINYLMVLAGLGFLIKLVKIIKSKKWENTLFVFLALTAVIYFLGITYYNYLFTLSHGFSFGIQGRYYFPVLVAQMVILLVGLVTLIPGKYKEIGTKTIGFLMIILNFIALWLIAKTYYNLTNINSFMNQVSQYKPIIFKGEMVYFWIILYLLSLGFLIACYFSDSLRQKFLNRS